MSSSKSFYRYKINSKEDLLKDTFLRRLRKAKQNCKSNFIFEIEFNENLDQKIIIAFLNENQQTDDLILVSPRAYLKLKFQTFKLSAFVFHINNINERETYENHFYEFNTHSLLFNPTTKPQLTDFSILAKKIKDSNESIHIFWRFQPYNPNLNLSLTVRDIANASKIHFNKFLNIEIENTNAPSHFELEPIENDSYKVVWQNKLADSNPLISVIIPTYNNSFFLHNVVLHLAQQTLDTSLYEVIITDDGSLDSSSELLQELFKTFPKKINLTYLHWSKSHKHRGSQSFFRSGLARNLGVRHSTGRYLQFLDSDMLVPPQFLESALESLKTNDLIQFQRFHINQDLSRTNPVYKNIELKKDTYIEEAAYWSQLFFCDNWTDLPHYWKYTCTYALGIKREDFIRIGMFKKYYISYGFEDTDLGFEAFNLGLKFQIVKLPLLHLTSYDQMQYKNSARKRLQLLRVTAELFYLQHLKKEIYELLIDFYRFQKPMKSFLRDLVS
jgi:glycosyltransferase involved in cell wall biosynthesis